MYVVCRGLNCPRVCCGHADITRTKRLQKPCASHSARCAGSRLSGVQGSNCLDVSLVVASGGDLQHRDDGTLIQQPIGRHDFSVALFTATHTHLEGVKDGGGAD